MAQRKLFLSVLALLVVTAWVPLAQASTINTSLTCFSTCETYVPLSNHLEVHVYRPTTYNESFDTFQGSSIGTFNQELSFNLRWTAAAYTLGGSSSPGSPSAGFNANPLRFYIDSDIVSEGPFYFDYAEWTAKITADGINWHDLDIYLGRNYIKQFGYPAINDNPYLFGHYGLTIEGSSEILQKTFGVGWEYDPGYIGWMGYGGGSLDLNVVITQSVHVVPLPPTLLLLGSGLGCLAIYGRRRLFDRSRLTK